MNRVTLPGAYRARHEYACDDCLASVLEMRREHPDVIRVEQYEPRADERCPACGKKAS